MLHVRLETSEMEVTLRDGRRQKRPVVRALFRTESGRTFSTTRVDPDLAAVLMGRRR